MNHQIQTTKQLSILREVVKDGVQMGILSDGCPYLTARGLGRLCGIDYNNITRLANDWPTTQYTPRGEKLKRILDIKKYKTPHLYIKVKGVTGESHAYPTPVCMALLEYYAYESLHGDHEIALKNYRLLAGMGVDAFIREQVGYDINIALPDNLKNYFARIDMNREMPRGYYSIFGEGGEFLMHMIRFGFPIDEHSVPDISIGRRWSDYWKDNNLEAKYGKRAEFPHNYPEWYPQAKANPVKTWIYPNESLGAFRTWLYDIYAVELLPKYLTYKEKSGMALPEHTTTLLESFKDKKNSNNNIIFECVEKN